MRGSEQASRDPLQPMGCLCVLTDLRAVAGAAWTRPTMRNASYGLAGQVNGGIPAAAIVSGLITREVAAGLQRPERMAARTLDMPVGKRGSA